jgi:hypothetical protein
MKKKKIYHSEVTRNVDFKTGEITQEEITTKSFAEGEPDFVKLYIKDIIRLKDLPPAADKVLLEIIGQMGYKNVFPAYAPIKRIMCQTLNMTMNTLNKSITQLHSKGILIRVEKGVYLVDPDLFARGRWEDIKSLRLVIEYDTKSGIKKLKSDAPQQLKQLALNFPE